MENIKSASKTPWLWIVGLSLAASILGFTLSYQEDEKRFNEMSVVVGSHLTYALQLKDDMALIDLSKSLEKLPSVLAFRATSDSKVVAEGGNKEFSPANLAEGLSFNFPYRWNFRSTLQKPNATSIELTLVFQDFRGPLFWSLCFFFLPLGMGWLLLTLNGSPQTQTSPTIPVTRTVKIEPAQTPAVHLDPKTLTLTLDKNYMIGQVTPLAAKALGRESADLIGNHFLDLLPDPLVMKSIEAGQKIRLIKPFPSHPHLSAMLHPTAEGSTLVFETSTGVEEA